MKRSAIITVAGCSSRFLKSSGLDVHKSIYSDDETNWTILLYQINLLKDCCDEIVVVTGYKHDEIKKYIELNFDNIPLRTVYNPHYADYGSAYSLIKGIEAISVEADEVIFVEGDLIFDTSSFEKIVSSNNDVITSNNLLIEANKAVIFYVDTKRKIKYLYDTNHDTLQVNEPFILMGNSGQVWKFTDVTMLKSCITKYNIKEYKGTNLVIVNDYYKDKSYDNTEVVAFKDWFNCNTINDYKQMKEYIRG